jgi:hypothetical protein
MKVTDLFDVKRGHQLDLTHLALAPKNSGIAYVSCTDQNNGVSGWVKLIESMEPAAAGTISVALVGATLAAFIQARSYYTAQNVEILTPIDPDMTFAEKTWWACCIRANRYRFNYGRKANRTFRSLELPDEVPDWVEATPRKAVAEMLESITSVGETIEQLPG